MTLNGSSINNCVLSNASGGAISSRGASVSLDKNSSITNCSVFEDDDISGGAIDMVEGMLDISGESFIQNCHVSAEEDAFGGAVSMKRGTVVLRGGSYITNCSVGSYENALGGAIYVAGGVVSLNDNSRISNCTVSADENASGGAIYSKGGVVNMLGGDIETCIASSNDAAFGGGICSIGGTVSMIGKSHITGCISKSDSCSFGGGISVFGGDLELLSGNILNCSAKNHGDAVHFGGNGKFRITKPGGELKISILSKENSHNSDAKVVGYWGIYKDGINAQEDEKMSKYYEIKVDADGGIGEAGGSSLNFVYIDKKYRAKDVAILSYLPKKLKKDKTILTKWVYNDGFSDREIDKNTKLVSQRGGTLVMINQVKAIYGQAG